MKQLKIGKVKLDNPLVLAPMAGVTDHAFRLLCKEHGVGLTCAEMISSAALVRAFDTIQTFNVPLVIPDYFSEQLTITNEKPVSLQLFGSDAEEMAKAAHILEHYADVIDINLGCPSPKLTGSEMGSKLLSKPDKIQKIVSHVSSVLKKPLTVKMRLGYSSAGNCVKIARICEKAGADAIAVHGRTTVQMYAGEADWASIERIKKSVSVPVIGNGDIDSPEMAKKRLETVDGIMIGRFSRGNPFIFSRTLHYLKTGELLPEPSKEDKLSSFERYLELSKFKEAMGDSRKERRKLADFKMQADYFMRGFPNSAYLRKGIHDSKSIGEITELIQKA